MGKVLANLIFIALEIAVILYPIQAGAVSCNSTTAIVYSNGMFNDQWQANASKDELEKKLVAFSPAYGNSNVYEFHLAYYSYQDTLGSALVQLLKVAVQWVNENIGDFWRWIAGIGAAPQWFLDAMVLMAEAQTRAVFAGDPDFQKMIDGDGTAGNPGYRKLLQDGKRVVVVAHSQGNFYANAAYDLLISENGDWAKSLGVTGVASPAGRVAGNGSYLTLPEDEIITPVPGSLPPLMDSAQQYPGFATLASPVLFQRGKEAWSAASYGHSFVQWYLMGNFSRQIIIDNIVATQNRLDVPYKHDWEVITQSNYMRLRPEEGSWIWGHSMRCLKDAGNSLGFKAEKRSGGALTISATSLSGTQTIPVYYDTLTPEQNLSYIVPVPNGVGIVYTTARNNILYWLDPGESGIEISGITSLHLISYVWDGANGAWNKTASEMDLPQFTMNFQNPTGCSSGNCPPPPSFPGMVTAPAYSLNVSINSSLYRWGDEAYQIGPNQSVVAFRGNTLGNDWTMHMATMRVDNGQIGTGVTYEYQFTHDEYWSGQIRPWSMGLPGRYVEPPRILGGSYLPVVKVRLMP